MREHFRIVLMMALTLSVAACTTSPSRSARNRADVPAAPASYPAESTSGPLYEEVLNLDTAFFDTFSHCSDSAQRARHAAFVDPSLEFYHDKGGASFGRAKYMADVEKNVCGVFERKRVEGSLRVYPVPGYGAMEVGSHMFCPFASGRCEGAGDFLVLWRKDADGWRVTRVFSYAHRPVQETM